MKNYLMLLMGAGLLLSGCSAAYKAGQTPDDVYYSYGADDGASSQRDRRMSEEEAYVSYWGNADDNYLRMKVRDRDRWSDIDDLNYWYGFDRRLGFNNPFMFNSWGNGLGWNMGLGNWWNPGFNAMNWNNPFGWGWNSFYNNWNCPTAWNRPLVVVNKFPTNSAMNTIRTTSRSNMSGYYNPQFQRGSNSIFDQSRSKTPSGDLFRSIYNTNRGGNTDSYSRPSRLFNSSSSGSSSSGFSSGSSSSGSSSSGSSRSSGGGGSSSRGGN